MYGFCLHASAARAGAACAADMRHRPYSLRPREGRRPTSAFALTGFRLRPSADRSADKPRALEKPRARGTPRVRTDPRASAPHGIEACRSPYNRIPPVLWRPARGVSRFAPYRPRWTDLSGAAPSGGWSAYPPLWPNAARGARLVRRDDAAWTAGPSRRISSAMSFPGHRSPPHVRDADQTPLGYV